MTTGFTAKVVTLPSEKPEVIQATAKTWHDTFQPVGRDEEELLQQLVAAALRLNRIVNAEEAIVTEQIQYAETDWKQDAKNRLVQHTERLHSEPARTCIALTAFGAGVTWLLDRWLRLQRAFHQFGCWNSLDLIELALRLEGVKPESLAHEPIHGYELAVLAISCVPNAKDDPALMRLLHPIAPEWFGEHGTTTSIEPAEAQKRLKEHIQSRVAELSTLAAEFQVRDARSLAGSSVRAGVPSDTPLNRLMLRYMNSTKSWFDRTYKTLEALQAARREAAEIAAKAAAEEASKGGLRNEPEMGGRTRSKRLRPGSCIKVNEVKYEVVQVSDGNLLLCTLVDVASELVSEVVPTPETVV